jgi:hypothetical protein
VVVTLGPEIRVGAHVYKLYVSNPVDFDGHDATVNHRRQEIYVAEQLSPSRKAVALWEELFHIIDGVSAIGLEHTSLKVLAEQAAEVCGSLGIELDWSGVPYWRETPTDKGKGSL